MPDRIEYPDEAGYPDGTGFLDEGTAVPSRSPLASDVDTPSSESEGDIVISSDATTFRATLDGQEVARMHIVRDGSRVTLTSTEVDPAVRERGIATAFIADVLDHLRDEGATIVVECPQVAAFIAANPEYADLVA
jgi:predicted GNAT family acetyltransferase